MTTQTSDSATIRLTLPKRWVVAVTLATIAGVVTTAGVFLTVSNPYEYAPLARTLIDSFGLFTGLMFLAVVKVCTAAGIAHGVGVIFARAASWTDVGTTTSEYAEAATYALFTAGFALMAVQNTLEIVGVAL